MLKLVIARGVPAEVQMLSRASKSPDNLSGQELAAVDDSTLEAAEFEADGMAGSAISSITPTTRSSGSVRGLNWLARSHDARWRPSDTADGSVARASGSMSVVVGIVTGRVAYIRLVFHPDESAAPASKEHAAGQIGDDSQRGLVAHGATFGCHIVRREATRFAWEWHRRSAQPHPRVPTGTTSVLQHSVRYAKGDRVRPAT